MDVLFAGSLPHGATKVPNQEAVASSEFGQVTLNGRMFIVQGIEIELKPKEAKLVRLLLEARGQIVSRSRLLREIDYHPDANTHTVENHIYRIRCALRARGIHEFILSASSTSQSKSQVAAIRGYSVNAVM